MGMKHESRIVAAIEQGEIKKVVIIDDAFDPPALGNDDAGPMLDFLENEGNKPTFKRAKLEEAEVQGAIAAIQATEYTDEHLNAVVTKLYGKFVEKFEQRFDPSGRFAALKGDNLRRVRPLLKLLGKCRGTAVTRIGSDGGEADFAALKPDAIFIDYYLDPTLSADAAPDADREQRARADSIGMLRRVLGGKPGSVPSVILMSSHSVRKEAASFRQEIAEGRKKLFASRFKYISKDDLEEEEDGSITVESAAADALLDIAQSHRYAGSIEEALQQWRNGVDAAVEEIWSTITDLELRDYAYLSRFRLAEEEQPFSSYLDWFLGEVLVDSVGRSVKWDHSSFKSLDAGATKNNAGGAIEGAFDGPTDRIAELYFRARVDARPGRQGTDMRTGDLYVHKDRPEEILAVVTPDCDLMLRDGKRKAKRMMVVAGVIQKINAPDSSIADYIQLGRKKAANIVWDPKDIRTLEYDAIGADTHSLVGTLRPLYAQELQRKVLSDLGRVGLAVAPALAMTAKASIVFAGANGPIKVTLANRGKASCVVIPKRGGSDKARIIYQRGFASDLLDKIFTQPVGSLVADANAHLGSLRNAKTQQQLLDKLCRDGQSDGEEAFGIKTSLKGEDTKGKIPWCQILVEYNVPDEQSDDPPPVLEAVDPPPPEEVEGQDEGGVGADA